MFTKYRDFSGEKQPYLFNFTQPNMAFTPRQIIEQFASGEVIAQENHPSDDFYDDKYSDDDLASVVQIDDEFQARQAVIDFQLEQSDYNESNAPNQIRDGSSSGTKETTPNVSVGDVPSSVVADDTPSV